VQVTVNGKPRGVWRVRDTMGVTLREAADEASGEVLSAEAASQVYRALSLRAFVIKSALGVFLGLCILVPGLAVAAPTDRIWVILTAAGMAGAVLLGSRWLYGRALATWSVRLGERAAALPPVGAAVRVDATGVKFGDRSAAWDRLMLEALELTQRSDDTSSVTTVDRLVAASANGPIALDRHFLRNGGAIVDTAFRKLARERRGGEG